MAKISVFGAGTWGLAIAILLDQNGLPERRILRRFSHTGSMRSFRVSRSGRALR